jgi:ribosomal RNA-processing protein 12
MTMNQMLMIVESPPTGDVAGTAYRETLTSADGFTRGPNGRIKFNKDTKKRRREEDAMDVDVDLDEMSPGKSKKTKKKDELKFGHEFKAKVSDDFDTWIKTLP